MEFVAQSYLLHLVECTNFANKSVTLVNMSYLSLLCNLGFCGGYAQGDTALNPHVRLARKCLLCTSK